MWWRRSIFRRSIIPRSMAMPCAGPMMLPAGRRLTAAHVALAAAVGLTAVEVRRHLRVAVFSTGDEIVEPGAPRPAAALYDANRFLLAGLIERLGAQPTDLGILP